MIEQIISFLNQFQLPVNFLAHAMIFISSFYVAIHNRKIPQRYITPLWYIGNISLFTAITIIIQWSLGPEFPLSYWRIGLLSETALNVAVSTMAIIIFLGTVRSDIEGSRLRKHDE